MAQEARRRFVRTVTDPKHAANFGLEFRCELGSFASVAQTKAIGIRLDGVLAVELKK